MSEPSLYERIGGEEKIGQIIDEMYERILADDTLSPFFVNTPMEKQKRMQTEFFCAALGGPIEYGGVDLYAAHRGRGITRSHLTRFVDHLLETLKKFELSDKDVNDICARISMYTNYILGESTSDG